MLQLELALSLPFTLYSFSVFLDAIAFYISNLIKRLYWRLLIVRVEKEMNYLWFIIFSHSRAVFKCSFYTSGS